MRSFSVRRDGSKSFLSSASVAVVYIRLDKTCLGRLAFQSRPVSRTSKKLSLLCIPAYSYFQFQQALVAFSDKLDLELISLCKLCAVKF